MECGRGLAGESEALRRCLHDFVHKGRDWRDGDVLLYALDHLTTLRGAAEAPGLMDKARWIMEMTQSQELMAALQGEGEGGGGQLDGQAGRQPSGGQSQGREAG